MAKKVLRIINRFNLGGITYNVAYLSKYLSSNYETLLIGGAEEEGEESSLHITDKLGLKPIIIEELQRSIGLKNDYAAYKRIKQIIKEYKPDIVHTHASKAGAVGRMAAIRCKVPIIVHTFHGHVFHSYFGKLKTAFYKSIERYLSKRTDAIIAISDIQKKELTETFKICSPQQSYVINLGFDLERFTVDIDEKRKDFRSKYNLQDDELAIGIIGRLAPVKNHELFIDAIENISKNSTKKVRAFIIGDGETRQQLENYLIAKKLPFTNEASNARLFCFTSWIKDVDWALAGLDLVALSSKNEGTPVSLIEAQAAGKFIVATNVGGTADILHKDCGLLCDQKKPQEFIDQLLNAVNNFETLSAKAKNGQQQVLQKFSYKRLANDVERLYDELLSRREAHC
ncbi:MAG TPA: glycosyltransferase [Bacteroidia bacterium]|jgi:glycosyltransferase involved in cell wall biosynthesis|nr:glycosyltransferase [Bacteroidia bacterium]